MTHSTEFAVAAITEIAETRCPGDAVYKEPITSLTLTPPWLARSIRP
ncbi:hypothetical protein QCN29_09445 [Streptomyces sp. HNM0663]|uniref:Uncharacterized protein n=1 Tax=Streptomyces chengmaiensis TaxID=3040919 RepID=A0ABT6HJV9_9ACTN|nr:hypothetical protein [Streptomyces chengmaiensis]MDH2389010.1 hypothetical protein [Streptomyces chengmaiensis]